MSEIFDQSEKGTIFNIQRYSIHDGPGIRTIVFMKGCPLSCLWCSNPESQKKRSELFIRKGRCIKCKKCIEVCPKNCINFIENEIFVERVNCDVCGKCTEVCMTDAITIIGKEVSIEELCEEVFQDKLFYDSSQGGVTFSGGEPFFQPEFLLKALKKCKEENINTVVETCGMVEPKIFNKLIQYIDIIYYDFKVFDSEGHKKATGVSNEIIIENLKTLIAKEKNVLVRLPIIPSINDDKGNLTQTAEFLSNIGIKTVQVLPYHNYGKSKYSSIGKTSILDVKTPSKEDIEKVKEVIEAFGIDVIL